MGVTLLLWLGGFLLGLGLGLNLGRRK